jgi:hypothetical protein
MTTEQKLSLAKAWLTKWPRLSGYAINLKLKEMKQAGLSNTHTRSLRRSMGLKIAHQRGGRGNGAKARDPLAKVIQKLASEHGIAEIHYANGTLEVKQIVTRTVKVSS